MTESKKEMEKIVQKPKKRNLFDELLFVSVAD